MLIYFFLIITFVIGLFAYSPISDIIHSFVKRETLFSLMLSLETSIIATVLAIIFAIPTTFYLVKNNFRGKYLIESLIDIPIILPPLIIGLGLLILFGNRLSFLKVAFTKTAIIVAQFFIITPIMINALKGVFSRFPNDYEKIALTIGLNKYGYFFKVFLPIQYTGIISAILLGMSRALGEFGATLMFAGATRFRTETMPIAIFLNISAGNFDVAISVALIYIAIAIVIFFGLRKILMRNDYENKARTYKKFCD